MAIEKNEAEIRRVIEKVKTENDHGCINFFIVLGILFLFYLAVRDIGADYGKLKDRVKELEVQKAGK